MNQQQAERCVYVMPTGRPGRYSMTPTQRRFYDGLIAWFDSNTHSPSYTEMLPISGLSRTSRKRLYEELNSLEERGWVCFNYHQMSGNRKPRSIRLTEPVMRFPRAV